jgi:protein-S-isoprenylcysteine O-methyltransferase Ste14
MPLFAKSVWLILRVLFWTLLLPGLVAFYIPWRFFGLDRAALAAPGAIEVVGFACILIGTLLLLVCILDFANTGRGTLSPLDPCRRLVVRGLYRYSRNPMYLSVALILTGGIILTRSVGMFWYALLWFGVVVLIVLTYEEPALRRQFGGEYDAYARAVPRWIPRLRPWRPDPGEATTQRADKPFERTR